LLYRDLQPRLLRYLHALAGQDAEDIAAETWLHITRDLAAFTGSYDAFRGWTATIARHRALDHIRHRSRRPPALPVPAHDLAGLPGTDDTAQGALDNLATSTALTLINTLPPDQAEAVLLRAVLGLDATTAGTILGKRAGAIRTAASRGLRSLQRRLENGEGVGVAVGLESGRRRGLDGVESGRRRGLDGVGVESGRRKGREAESQGLTGGRRTREIPSR
jgi:RNA polymerase sigma-70 factor (ECF subfamily)